LVNQLGLCQ